MNDADLAFASIEEVARLFRKSKLSPVELTQLMLERIERLNPRLNAYITVPAEFALEQARQAERELLGPRGKRRDRGPLHGIPISLKDNICTAGIRTTAGSKILSDFVPKEDAPLVGLLRQAGAVILDKTNMHEFAYGVTSNNPHFGPVRNPWDLGRIAGGSSGGSIRIPAALCGVVGLKPTLGRVSVEGVIPLSPRLDCVGPLARTARDAAILLDAIFVRGKRERPLTSIQKTSMKSRKVRLGVPSE